MKLKTDVTVYYVVQNEDMWIRRSVSIATEFADSVLVVDTGSTDRTLGELSKTEAEVIEHGMIKLEEFSAVKNLYLEQIETPLVLLVDGNEIITKQGYSDIERAINQVDWNMNPKLSIPSYEPVKVVDRPAGPAGLANVSYVDFPRHRARLCVPSEIYYTRPFGTLRLLNKREDYGGAHLGLLSNFPGHMWHMRLMGQSSKDDELPLRKKRNGEARARLLEHPIKVAHKPKEDFFL